MRAAGRPGREHNKSEKKVLAARSKAPLVSLTANDGSSKKWCAPAADLRRPRSISQHLALPSLPSLPTCVILSLRHGDQIPRLTDRWLSCSGLVHASR